jgi:dynein heavy chain
VAKNVQDKSDMCRKYFKDGINKVLDKLRAKINEQTEEEDKKNEFAKKKVDDQPQPKQLTNSNPTLDALGFNHSLKYGNRSKLRTACMRFLRFSYLLDFLATEALSNIYIFSVQDTIRRFERLV